MFKVHYYTHFLIFCIFFSSSSTKANVPQEITAAGDLNDYTIPGMYYCAWNSVAQQMRHMPPGLDNAFALFVELGAGGQAVQTFKSAFDLHIYTRQKSHYDPVAGWVETWSGWERLATATKPQEHPLPLAAGYVVAYGQACDYSVAQDKLVVVHVSVARQDGANLNGVLTLATLPAGVRPAKAVVSAAAFGIYLKADTNGAITCHAPGTYDSIGGTLVFYAAA